MVNFADSDGVYPKNICLIRSEISDYIVNKTYPFCLSTKSPQTTLPRVLSEPSPKATIPPSNQISSSSLTPIRLRSVTRAPLTDPRLAFRR